MDKFAVIKTGGKQYLVKEDEIIFVDRINFPEKEKISLETLAIFDSEGKKIELGEPFLAKKTQAEIIAHVKGEKIRVAKFKAKVRYRKVKGFRQALTVLKIINIQ